MEIKETIEKTVQVEIVKEVLCNGCEKNIFTNGHTLDGCRATFDFEYGSAYDGHLKQIHLCDKCFEAIVADSLTLPPTDLI